MEWYLRLKKLRVARGIKKVDLARMIGVSPPTITQWERGDTESPSAANILKICDVLLITPAQLIQGTTSKISYIGQNKQIAEAVAIMETLQDADVERILAVIKTLASTAS